MAVPSAEADPLVEVSQASVPRVWSLGVVVISFPPGAPEARGDPCSN